MYDSGGISLKPSNRVHAQMKNDMSGAAAVLRAFTALCDLGCGAEPVWQMPLWQPYRRKFDRSSVADLPNLASADTPELIASSLFARVVGDTPWAHIDIASTAQNEEDRSWHPAGCSGFGARLLVPLAVDFSRQS